MGWRRVILSAEERVKGAGQDLKIDFEIAFIAAGVPEAAALFVETADVGDLYYFSPEASRIFGSELDAVRAGACPPPCEGNVDIAVGHRRAVNLVRAS
jgi:hypothetical protein